MFKKYFILTLCLGLFMAFATNVQAQSRTVSGVVVSEDGKPVIGASVTVPGTTIGVSTGTDGSFSLTVPANSRIEVSFVGYVPQTVTDLSVTRIVLQEDLMELENVVVVGYGVQKAKHLTGAVATVDPEEIKDFATGDLASALSGMVPGLGVSGGFTRPGTAATLTVRQASAANSITTSYENGNSPLYVIDDYVSDETTFNNLNPNEIESITILKDAAAAVYGVRAAQGVILITTKKGHIGAPKISYQGQFGFTDEIKRAKMLNAYDYGVLWNTISAGNTLRDTDYDDSRDLFQYEELQAMKNLNFDPLEREWKMGYTQRHSVNISGGTEKATYFGSISYFNQDGNMGKLDYDRWNYRAGITTNIGSWFKANLAVSGSYGSQTNALNKLGGSNNETDYNVLLTHPRYIPEYVDGRPIMSLGVSNTEKNKVQLYHYDAAQKAASYSTNTPQNMNINMALEHDFGWSRILSGLKMKLTYSKTVDTSKSNELATEYVLYQMLERGSAGLGLEHGHLYTGNDINLDESNFVARTISLGSNSGEGESYLRRSMSRSDRYQLNFTANYARTFGLHSVSGLFTIEKSESDSENLWGQVQNPYIFTDGQSSSGQGEQTTAFGRSESGMLSYVGRLNYIYNDRYMFEFLLRADASTRFAPANYWGIFPSFSAGWVISQEDWFNVRGIDFLKFRGSWGITGKDNIDAWGWLQLYGVNSYNGAVFGTSPSNYKGSGITMSEAPNPDAHWDKSYKTNFGIDFRSLRNRLSVTFDAYYDMGRDMFADRKGIRPSTLGTQTVPENYGEMDLWGVELTVGWKDRIGSDWSYFVNVNSAYSDNKVKKMYWSDAIDIDKVHPNQRTDTGIWGLECLGIFRDYQQIQEYFAETGITNYLGLSPEAVQPGMLIYKDQRGAQNQETGEFDPNPDGIIHKDYDMIRISKRASNPYGFSMNFGGGWKNLSLRAQLAVSWGSYTMMGSNMRTITNLVGDNSGWKNLEFVNVPSYWANNTYSYADVYDANGNIVATANRNAKYPSLRYNDINNRNSTFWTVSGTRVTLSNITLAYSLPTELISKVGIASCRINFTAQNLFSFYNPYPDNFIDPQSSYGSYPKLRQFNVGVNVSF